MSVAPFNKDFPPLGFGSSRKRNRIQNNFQFAGGFCSNGAKLGDTYSDPDACFSIRAFNKSNNYKGKNQQNKCPSKTVSDLVQQSCDNITSGSEFVRSRVGILTNIFHEDVDQLLKTYRIGHKAHFVVLPIEPSRSYQNPTSFNAIPDLATSGANWRSSIALSLGDPNLDSFSGPSERRFSDLLDHAIYLPVRALLIDCPNSKTGCISLASILNDRLVEYSGTMVKPLILFKLPLVRKNYKPSLNQFITIDKHITLSTESGCASGGCSDQTNSGSNKSSESSYGPSNESTVRYDYAWAQWNNMRSHLIPDPRIGVCLVIDDDLPDDEEELERWTGEPVRMIVLSADQFVTSPSNPNHVRMSPLCKRFLRKVATFNSLKTSFVVEASSKQTAQIDLLSNITNTLRNETESRDQLLPWHDRLLIPLQPLSSNLDSETYEIFEIDSIKYIIYRDAMVEAIQTLIARRGANSRRLVLMVLGAGRGPLVDRFIEAIHTVGGLHFRYKIYALDKNKSSVQSLRYKQKTKWLDKSGVIETEVVEADMRDWEPGLKADIVATELLGSFADNELSPECIDGLWKFCSPSTISIPQKYSSYIAPISSFKMHQQLYCRRVANVFDKIYVVNLTNCYYIDDPKKLFDFSHANLSRKPKPHQNERYKQVSFHSKVDTLCHGFAGFFSAKLYGTVELSTVYNGKTPSMDSWFAAYIPLEQPIQMPKGTKLTVHFWRKESYSKVWYQWGVTEPVTSRIYSPVTLSNKTDGTAMSKFTN